jgi:hypothetical protein
LELPVPDFCLTRPAEKLLSKLFPTIVGGGKRDRTDDLLHAMQALSQLSYTPDTKTTASFLAPVELQIIARKSEAFETL